MTVSPAQIATTLGRPTPTGLTSAQWSMWINDARQIIGNRLGNLDDLNQDTLDYVVREAVAEKIRNTRTEDTTSETVTVDDATVTKRWEDNAPTQIEILDEWWDLFNTGQPKSGAFNIRPYPKRRRGCWPAEV